MSEHVGNRPPGEGVATKRRLRCVVLVGLIFARSAMLAAAARVPALRAADRAAGLVRERRRDPGAHRCIAAIWLGVHRPSARCAGSAWMRGAIVVWQVLQLAIAIGSFQGLFARPDIGWLLVDPGGARARAAVHQVGDGGHCAPRRRSSLSRSSALEAVMGQLLRLVRKSGCRGSCQASTPSFLRSIATWPVAFTL